MTPKMTNPKTPGGKGGTTRSRGTENPKGQGSSASKPGSGGLDALASVLVESPMREPNARGLKAAFPSNHLGFHASALEAEDFERLRKDAALLQALLPVVVGLGDACVAHLKEWHSKGSNFEKKEPSSVKLGRAAIDQLEVLLKAETLKPENRNRYTGILQHRIKYSYVDGFEGEMREADRKHIETEITRGLSRGGLQSGGPGHTGWWEIRERKEATTKFIKILQHRIEYWYVDGFEEEMDEADEEHIETLIKGGFNQGELNTTDPDDHEKSHRGWWRINNE